MNKERYRRAREETEEREREEEETESIYLTIKQLENMFDFILVIEGLDKRGTG